MKLYCINLDEMCGGCRYWSLKFVIQKGGWGECSAEFWSHYHATGFPYVVIKHNKSDHPCLYRKEISTEPVTDWLFEEDK